jgi:hypothetical protein
MEVVIDGKKHLVSWAHDLEARTTICIITVTQPAGGSAACFAAGSRVHPKDQYVKETGRRRSLKAVLKQLWPDPEKPEEVDAARAKARLCRALVWEAYWNSKKRKEKDGCV